jgi:plastocyanin
MLRRIMLVASLLAVLGVTAALARPPVPRAAADPVTVVIQDFAYHPKDLTISAGTKVKWVNKDAHLHTATAYDGSFNTGDLGLNQESMSIPFSTPGKTIKYRCLRHPGIMQGTVTVTP